MIVLPSGSLVLADVNRFVVVWLSAVLVIGVVYLALFVLLSLIQIPQIEKVFVFKQLYMFVIVAIHVSWAV